MHHGGPAYFDNIPISGIWSVPTINLVIEKSGHDIIKKNPDLDREVLPPGSHREEFIFDEKYEGK